MGEGCEVLIGIINADFKEEVTVDKVKQVKEVERTIGKDNSGMGFRIEFRPIVNGGIYTYLTICGCVSDGFNFLNICFMLF